MRPSYSPASRLLGWLVGVLYVVNSVISTRMPRTAKDLPLREELRDWHMVVGLALLVAVGVRLALWLREGPVAPPAGVSRGAHALARGLALTSYVLIFVTGLIGIGFAWGSGYRPPLLPLLFADDYGLWKFTGYFHSAISFSLLLLNVATLIHAVWMVFRYRAGWLKVFPEPFVLQAYGAFLSTLYALVNTGASKQPGVEIGLAVGAAVWALSLWRRRDAATPAAGAAA